LSNRRRKPAGFFQATHRLTPAVRPTVSFWEPYHKQTEQAGSQWYRPRGFVLVAPASGRC